LLVIAGAAGRIEIVSVAFPVPPKLVALMVAVEFPAVVGVPEIKPVAWSTLRPAGKTDAPNEVGLLLAAIW